MIRNDEIILLKFQFFILYFSLRATMRDVDYKRIPCKRCIEDIAKAPVFTNLYLQAMKKKNQDLDLVPHRQRCLLCLKFKARDPTKVSEDEVAELKICSGCHIAEYCSEGDCQEKHAPVHKWFCKPFQNFKIDEIAWQYNSTVLEWSQDGQVEGKIMSKKEHENRNSLTMIHLFVQGILSLNGNMLAIFREQNYQGILQNPYIDYRAKEGYYLTKEACITAIFLGDWEYVNLCTKTELMKNVQIRRGLTDCFGVSCLPMPKHLVKCGIHDNIIKALKKDELLDTSFTDEEHYLGFSYVHYLLMAAIGKLHAIEDMKWLLLQHNLHLQKTRPRKKFFHHPRILNCITLYILGKDVKTFEKDIAKQEKHLNKIVQAIDDIRFGDSKIGSSMLYKLFLADVSKKFSVKDKVWLDVNKAREVEQFVVETSFIWNFYFSINPSAKEFVKKIHKNNNLTSWEKNLKSVRNCFEAQSGT